VVEGLNCFLFGACNPNTRLPFFIEMANNEIIAFAASLPYATKGSIENKLTYQIGKKPFIFIDEEKSAIAIRVTEKKLNSLLNKAGFFDTEIETKKPGWVGIDLTKIIDSKDIKELVIDSFHLMANKKALEALYTEFPL
jgi:predicted DNA-binding protein (MmcQ/YjbR family)